ncbi:adenylyl-sulfate kinase [Streptococcus suis]|uniref:adenylyl-sulfate kinase n=1 Tax=Streptococcus suis TaxID=1307 RepID=UPI00240FE7F9|nr:adenylyl-sulfate kinase [Streptococcus suis]MDG3135252.1 adenylyl-sulfate kinase [Streptococcus suis]
MIIWLNGPFGVGKTTLANILHKRIENSYLYDPELLGDFLQHQLNYLRLYVLKIFKIIPFGDRVLIKSYLI